MIEESYRRLLRAARRAPRPARASCWAAGPAASDFALFGQLTQLAGFDPTPTAIALAARAARRRLGRRRRGSLRPRAGASDDWIARDAVPDTLRALLAEVGRVYAPFLLANAAALARGAEQVECRSTAAPWTQRPSPTRASACAGCARRTPRSPPTTARAVDALLAGTGCEALFADGTGVRHDEQRRVVARCWRLIAGSAAAGRPTVYLKLHGLGCCRASARSDPAAARGACGRPGPSTPAGAAGRSGRRTSSSSSPTTSATTTSPSPAAASPTARCRRRTSTRSRATASSFTAGLRRQRHLRAVARGDHDRPLPDALRLRVHAGAEAVHAPRRAAWGATDAARPPIYSRRAREGRAADGPAGRAARARSRSPSCCRRTATTRSGSASGTSARRRALRPERAGLRRVPRLPAPARRCTCRRTTRTSSTRVQDFDPIDRFLWANLPFAVAQERRPALRARRLHDRLPRRRGGEGDRRPTATGRSSCTSRFNAPHTPLQALRADYDALPQHRGPHACASTPR